MIFIDANKPDYKSYLDAILSLGLLAPGGIILADNTAYKGYPWATSAAGGASPYTDTASNNRSLAEATVGIAQFNQAAVSHPDLFTTVLPIRDGISLIRRK